MQYARDLITVQLLAVSLAVYSVLSTSADAHQLDNKSLSDVPGVTQVAIGVTRDGTEIPVFITQADLDVFANKTRVLIVGGLDGSPHTTKAAVNVMQRFYTKAEFEPLRQFFSLSVIPCGNPDGLAKGLRNDNGSGGDPSRGYPPSGDATIVTNE